MKKLAVSLLSVLLLAGICTGCSSTKAPATPMVSNLRDGTSGNDNINGTAGNDTINGLDGDDIINGGDGDDTLYGDDGKDVLNGGNEKDILNGGNGKDVLNGGNGDDTLIGGKGNDLLNGGQGDDTYIFSKGNGNDVIVDIEGNNTIKLLDITTSDIKGLTKKNNLDLFIQFIPSGSIIITDYFSNQKSTFKILFADGTIWTSYIIDSKLQEASESVKPVTN